MGKLVLNKKGIIGVVGFVLAVVLVGLFLSGRVIKIDKKEKTSQQDQDSQSQCDYSKRPLAVMFASDPITRPLSGISEADIYFEMPVNQFGVTRMMAVYYCSEPEEIGSVRSARKEFIPLAGALDAIYAHWGGEHNALDQLNAGALDNIDALKYEDVYYFRKKGVKRPHNGFTSYELLNKAIKDFKYSSTNSGQAAVKKNKSVERVKEAARDILTVDQPQIQPVPVLYAEPYDISWTYDEKENKYLRFRTQQPEIDKTNSEQVRADKIIVLQTIWSPVNIDYIDVKVTGAGKALIYESGQVFKGTWEKSGDSIKTPLIIKYDDGKPVDLLPGKTWIHYIF